LDQGVNKMTGKIFQLQEGDKFLVTGLLYNSNRRFKAMTFNNWAQARSINLWRGSRWILRNGKRILVETVYN